MSAPPLSTPPSDPRPDRKLDTHPLQRLVQVGGRWIGPNCPVFVVAEIGINHNGDLELAHAMIDVAADAGCDAVKFQKRTPELCVPRNQWMVERDTPWGRMTYLGYRSRVELDHRAFVEI